MGWPGVDLVYWDYYHMRKDEYAWQLQKHAALPAPTVFAGGIWTWCGPAPDYEKTRITTEAGLTACRKAGVPLVFATAWGDNGAEGNLYTTLLGMQMYAELPTTVRWKKPGWRSGLRACCRADAAAFWDLTAFNKLPGMRSGDMRPVNLAKILLYQDPLVQLFTADLAGYDLAGTLCGARPALPHLCGRGRGAGPALELLRLLADVLAKKCAWHAGASAVVTGKDRAAAARLADALPDTIRAVEALRTAWAELWNATNKPQGVRGH